VLPTQPPNLASPTSAEIYYYRTLTCCVGVHYSGNRHVRQVTYQYGWQSRFLGMGLGPPTHMSQTTRNPKLTCRCQMQRHHRDICYTSFTYHDTGPLQEHCGDWRRWAERSSGVPRSSSQCSATGVIGLSTAIRLQEKENYVVSIVAETFPTDPKCIKYCSHWAVSLSCSSDAFSSLSTTQGAHHVCAAAVDDLQQQSEGRLSLQS